MSSAKHHLAKQGEKKSYGIGEYEISCYDFYLIIE